MPYSSISRTDRPGDARQLLGQCHEGARIIGTRKPLFIGSQAADVVHLEQQLAGAESVEGRLIVPSARLRARPPGARLRDGQYSVELS